MCAASYDDDDGDEGRIILHDYVIACAPDENRLAVGWSQLIESVYITINLLGKRR